MLLWAWADPCHSAVGQCAAVWAGMGACAQCVNFSKPVARTGCGRPALPCIASSTPAHVLATASCLLRSVCTEVRHAGASVRWSVRGAELLHFSPPSVESLAALPLIAHVARWTPLPIPLTLTDSFSVCVERLVLVKHTDASVGIASSWLLFFV